VSKIDFLAMKGGDYPSNRLVHEIYLYCSEQRIHVFDGRSKEVRGGEGGGTGGRGEDGKSRFYRKLKQSLCVTIEN